MASELFFSRELSWIEFNARVLEEALDQDTPLLERLKFLIIVASNFDEFFMVRVASLKARARSGNAERDSAGLSPAQTLAAVSTRVREILGRQYDCLLREILPALADKGLSIVRPSSWSASERHWLERYFADSVAPALTPLRVETTENGKDIFPTAGNLRVHAAFLLKRADGQAVDAREEPLALVQVPPNLERLVRLPSEGSGLRLALIDDIVAAFGSRLFPGYGVREGLLFKVTRDADIGVDEDRDADFLAAMEEVLADRQNSHPVRLCVSPDSQALAERIRAGLGLDPDDLYAIHGPLELKDLLELADGEGVAAFPGIERLRYEAWPPIRSALPPEGVSIWDEIKRQDRLLHLPYESFDPVVHFLDEASIDPAVLAIKMTLYRTSGNSPIVKALTRAARNGKQVAVLIEVKARFDEERNIAWASRLEQAGAIVVYGLARLKVHAKAALVVRREDSGTIRRYLHLSTGNYNDKTARLYADLSIFTANEDLCREASIFFNMITGYSAVQELRFLAVAPFDLKSRLISMIEREAQRSSAETPGLIMAKLNSLADPEIIKALYKANDSGVRVMLNVRGITMLVPGQKGLSEHISVVSVVGRYLEHARIIYFRNGGAEELYLSSADWMPRNLERRVELMFPVLDEEARRRVLDILSAYFKDNSKAHRLGPSGRWRKVEAGEGEEPFSAQAYFYEAVKRRHALAEEPPERSLQVRKRPN
jgi:polyphosphate kinase